MLKVEETLASYLSHQSASSLKALTPPTKPVRTTSALVGKAYSAVGQAAAFLHTMDVLQAYQADVLEDLNEDRGNGPDTVAEVGRATDLSLRAIKETARTIGRAIAALVATERQENLSSIKEKHKSFLMDSLLSPPGLFGDAVNTVVERSEEAHKQGAAFQKLLPCCSQVSGGAIYFIYTFV